ncbi:TRAP transporter small permease [Pseudomonas benzenivorans]|uniref:TRAP transporter small permease protein n=1 Tax=Pseudomonas benzenivorans TaxID=556533 RepID=A0ABY5H6S1_9PSED|nr:TRAP transporter small permease [Pseudomonas benzenivorans]UTW08010.1 TRAP transporter small permease [Pseudomonas benzenivorans]
MKDLLVRFDRRLNAVFRFCLVLLALVLSAVMVAAAFLRYFTDQSLPAVEEVSILLGVWIYFISMIVVTRDRGHLTGGVLELLDIGNGGRRAIRFINDLIGLLVMGVFLFYTIEYLLFVYKIGRKSTNMNLSTTVWVAAAVVGFFFMFAYKIRDLFFCENAVAECDGLSRPVGSEVKG